MAKATQKKGSGIKIFKPIGAFFRHFHLLIFFVLIVGCVAALVYIVNYTIVETPDDTYTSPITPGSIDQSALEKVQSLHSSNQPSGAPELPSGRINPFGE